MSELFTRISGSRGFRLAGARLAGMRRGPLAVAILLGLLTGCESSRKLSGGGPGDYLLHDVLGQERPTQYYYGLLAGSRDEETSQYFITDDEYLVDKNVDAVTKLGSAAYPRLEGQAVVVGRLVDVLLDDPSSLAAANAAGSLGQLGAKLPDYPQRGPDDRGSVLVGTLQAMDALHTREGVRQGGAGAATRLASLVTQLGDLRITDTTTAQQALRPFHNRAYLIDETDPTLRRAIDTALTKRMRSLILVALQAGISSDSEWVRADAFRALKHMASPAAREAAIEQLDVEFEWRVRGEAVEYLGRVGGAPSVGALLPLLDDGDPALRMKSRAALTRIAARDLGPRRRVWERWASQRYPGRIEGLDEEEGVDAPLPESLAPGRSQPVLPPEDVETPPALPPTGPSTPPQVPPTGPRAPGSFQPPIADARPTAPGIIEPPRPTGPPDSRFPVARGVSPRQPVFPMQPVSPMQPRPALPTSRGQCPPYSRCLPGSRLRDRAMCRRVGGACPRRVSGIRTGPSSGGSIHPGL